MGNWTTAVQELRELLNDQPNDRYCYRKKCFGTIDGSNVLFKTFEFRRQTNFSDDALSASPLGVYLNGVRVDPSQIVTDDVLSGEFSFVTAPTDDISMGSSGSIVQATYYYKWFEDDELSSFLTSGSRWLQQGEDFTNVAGGLREAALNYAAQKAINKMCMRWVTRASSTFNLEDAAKKEAMDMATAYSKIAKMYGDDATKMQKDFYTKSGQNLAAFSADNWGSVSNVTPRR